MYTWYAGKKEAIEIALLICLPYHTQDLPWKYFFDKQKIIFILMTGRPGQRQQKSAVSKVCFPAPLPKATSFICRPAPSYRAPWLDPRALGAAMRRSFWKALAVQHP